MDKTHAAWDHLFHQQHKKGFIKKITKKRMLNDKITLKSRLPINR